MPLGDGAGFIRARWGELARRCGAPEDDVRIAVGDGVGNAVVHAFRGRDPGTITVRAWPERDRLLVR